MEIKNKYNIVKMNFQIHDVRKDLYCFRLKSIIDQIMPAAEEKYKKECQRIVEEK